MRWGIITIMVNKKEKSILEEIKEDIKEIKELLKNPKRLIDNEKHFTSKEKREITIKDPNSPATEKQKEYLINAKYLGDVEKLTKLEASKLIEMYINKGGKNESIHDF